MNRAIRERDLEAIYVTGPGHGGPALVANAYLEGRYSEVYPDITEDEEGMRRLFRQFSFPGGIPSHVAPETPGSIHEGGELGYSLAHAFGAVFDNPDLLVPSCVVGDGEAETGALATSWHSNKFLSPRSDGAVLPILHLNGYKIANPTVLARIPEHELDALLEGYGWRPITVTVRIRRRARRGRAPAVRGGPRRGARRHRHDPAAARGDRNGAGRPAWPMLVLRSPKGWTGPRELDGTAGRELVALAPGADRGSARRTMTTSQALEDWMRSYRPEELFDEHGTLRPDLATLSPSGDTAHERDPATPTAASSCATCRSPTSAATPSTCPTPGKGSSEPMRVLGELMRDVTARNADRFRVFGPDETASNRLGAVFEVTDRVWEAEILATDDHLATDGRVMEVLSEHLCQGWLEGYLLTGRHGVFNCYEAFIHIIDSMMNQHAKWLKVTRDIPWRRPIASLNYLLSSHVWRQDHNGFSHQDPGFIDHVVNKKAEIVRVYLPPDANCLLSVADHCLRSRALRERDRRREAARASTTCRSTRRSRTARAGSGSGSGRRTTTAASPTSCWRAAATSRRSRRSPRSRSCASASPTCRCASSTSST